MYCLKRIDKLDELTEWFPKIEHYLALLLPYAPEQTKESVVYDLCSGRSKLWIVVGDKPTGFFTTKVLNYPAKKVLLGHLLGGENLSEWIGLIEELEAYGRDIGCESVEIQGRHGWKKYLDGYRTDRILYTKEIV